MENNRALLEILQDLRGELSLLTVKVKTEALKRFHDDFLTTEQRKSIYNSFDGEKDAAEIAKIADCSLRNVQLLIKELEEKDLIEIRREGRTKIPIKTVHKVALFYASKDLNKGGGSVSE